MNENEWTARRSCVYNDGVECERTLSCVRCGWRPAVSRRRAGEIRRAMREAGTESKTSQAAAEGVLKPADIREDKPFHRAGAVPLSCEGRSVQPAAAIPIAAKPHLNSSLLIPDSSLITPHLSGGVCV